VGAAAQDVGRSQNTPTKQRDLRYILDVHMNIVGNIHKKLPNWPYERYVYLDLTAGDGGPAGTPGSPLIAAAEAAAHQMPIDLWLCEQNADTMAELERRTAALRPPICYVHLLPGDHINTVPFVLAHYATVKQPLFGLAYYDPNSDPLPVPLIKSIITAPGFARVDVLAHINANGAYKRTPSPERRTRYLSDDLDAIPKDVRLIRQPLGQWQWTFAYLTDHQGAPRFRNLNFVDIDSDQGHEVLTRLALTRRERNPMLPF
jgi:hypothetical protein